MKVVTFTTGQVGILYRTKSEATLRRLSHYARCLRMAIDSGSALITSTSLAEPCGISPASVRKDLSSYGEFGKQGSGYDPRELLKVIEGILGTSEPPPVVLLGAGNLGRSLLQGGIHGTRYRFHSVFDRDHRKTGSIVGGHEVHPVEAMEAVLEGVQDFIGMLAVTPGAAQEAVDHLVDRGCRAILSFNVEPVRVPEGVNLRYTDMPFEMDLLSHGLKRFESSV